MRDLKLVAQPSKREGFESFTDLYLTWRYNDKVYCVRVRPQFHRDFKILLVSLNTSNKANQLRSIYNRSSASDSFYK